MLLLFCFVVTFAAAADNVHVGVAPVFFHVVLAAILVDAFVVPVVDVCAC